MSLFLSATDSSTISRRSYRRLENVLWTTSYTSAPACGCCDFISFVRVGECVLGSKTFPHTYLHT